MGMEIDALVAGNCILYKYEQDEGLGLDYSGQFEDDCYRPLTSSIRRR